MKIKIKRILKVTFFVIGIVFIVIVLIKGVNGLIYNSVTPKKFQAAYWEGNWSNSETIFISGKMMVDLPYKLPLNKYIKADMLVYYNLWSFYKPCSTKEFSINCFISDNNSTTGNLSLADTANLNNTKEKSLYFSAKITNDIGQSMDYNGIINSNCTKIIGGYISTNPDDFGNFLLKRI